MFCEKCFKPFAECKCYKGKDRVRQYIHLIRKELDIIEDVLFKGMTYHIRTGGVTNPAKLIKIVRQPCHLILSADFEFDEKDGYDKVLKEGPSRTLVKVKVITELELLYPNQKLAFKQKIKLLYVAVQRKEHDADMLTATWTLGS